MRTAILLSGLLIASEVHRLVEVVAGRALDSSSSGVVTFVASALIVMMVMDVVDFFRER